MGIFEEAERKCYVKLVGDSEFYREILEKDHELLDKHRFLSVIVDSNESVEPI